MVYTTKPRRNIPDDPRQSGTTNNTVLLQRRSEGQATISTSTAIQTIHYQKTSRRHDEANETSRRHYVRDQRSIQQHQQRERNYSTTSTTTGSCTRRIIRKRRLQQIWVNHYVTQRTRKDGTRMWLRTTTIYSLYTIRTIRTTSDTTIHWTSDYHQLLCSITTSQAFQQQLPTILAEDNSETGTRPSTTGAAESTT
eukprot:4787823-Amphidinium_carterae.1